MIKLINKFSWLFLVCSIAFMISKIFFGLDFTDSFYHLNYAATHSGREISFFTPLSVYLIKLVSYFASDMIIVYRIINVLITLSLFMIPFSLIKVENKPKKVFITGLLILLYSPFVTNIFGWDTFSAFFLLLTYVAFYKYMLTNANRKWLYILGVLSGLSILSRIPNVLAVFIVIPAIYFKYNQAKRSRILDVLLYVIVTVVTITIFYFFNYKGSEPMSGIAVAGSSSHSLDLLFQKYYKDLLNIVLYIVLLSVFIFSVKKFQRQFLKHKKYLLLGLLSLIVVYAVGLKFLLISPLSRNLALLYVALLIIIIVTIFSEEHHIYQKLKPISAEKFKIKIRNLNIFPKSLSNQSLILMTTIPFMFIGAMGSNTGLVKIVYSLPFLIFLFFLLSKKKQKLFFKVLVFLLPFSILESFVPYQDSVLIHKAYTKLPYSNLKYILTTHERSKTLQKVINMTDSLENKGFYVGYFGAAKQIFEYQTKNYLNENAPFDQNLSDTIVNIDKLKNSDKAAIFILDAYPSENSEKDMNTNLMKQLGRLKFKFIKKDELTIALKEEL